MASQFSPVTMRRLGRLVRAHREATEQWTLIRLASHLGLDKAVLSRLETKGRWPANRDLAETMIRILSVLGVVGEEFEAAMRLVGEARHPNSLATGDDVLEHVALLADYEEHATRITTVETTVFPGLLQTPAYAAELVAGVTNLTPLERQARVTARLDRQRILDTVNLSVVVLEVVLSIPIGGQETLAEQLEHVRHVASLDNVSIRVLPLSQARLATDGSFTLLEFRDQPGLVFADGPCGSVFVDAPEKVAHRMRLADRLRECALSEAESAELITRHVMEMRQERERK